MPPRHQKSAKTPSEKVNHISLRETLSPQHYQKNKQILRQIINIFLYGKNVTTAPKKIAPKKCYHSTKKIASSKGKKQLRHQESASKENTPKLTEIFPQEKKPSCQQTQQTDP